MKAGRMRTWLRLKKPVYEANKFGEEAVSYQLSATVHAERVRMDGRRAEEVGEHFADYSAEYNIRDVHTVDENWRAEEPGGKLYAVTAIVPNAARGYKTLKCVRVNE